MRGSRANRPLAFLGLGIGLLVASIGLVTLIWFRQGSGGLGGRPLSARGTAAMEPSRSNVPPPIIPDADFLGPLPKAARSWWEARGPMRTVVDQVYLVPDVPTFLEAIGEWDEWHYFPILIDDPSWTLPFLTSFRPWRVVKISPAPGGEGATGDERWSAAVRAVGRSWSRGGENQAEASDGARPPEGLGKTPPGVVLSDPDSPSLAGGVALAAGRFQPLVRFETGTGEGVASNRRPGRASSRRGFSNVLSLAEAYDFAKQVENRVAAIIPDHGGLGDACDFLTIAGDWPYRYKNDRAEKMAYGDSALDDLIGRVLKSDLGSINKTKDRWSFNGRLLGDPAASVYRAMCSLFLPPDSALLWNTYGGGEPWKFYQMNPAAEMLARVISGPLRHRAGAEANLLNWHQFAVGSPDRSRLVLFNSSGDPKRFAIEGGAGRPADIPPGGPTAVVIIHSFSAADPTDPRTIAGRWLANGAFAYYGSMNEPFLNSFRPAPLEVDLLSAGVPMGAAVREGPGEPFGTPWRLVYLGDPLYGLDLRNRGDAQNTTPVAGEHGFARIFPRSWNGGNGLGADRLREIRDPGASEPTKDAASVDSSESDLTRCLETAILATLGTEGGASSGTGLDASIEWRHQLASISRVSLSPREQPIWDALVLEAIRKTGAGSGAAPWYERLATIPPGEWSPKVEAAMEFGAMNRLASASRAGDFSRSLVIWDELIRRHWPGGSSFLSQVTERVGSPLTAPDQLRRWLDHLEKAHAALSADPLGGPALAVVAVERRRVRSKLGQ